jgi:hypothetical protein
MFHKVFIIQLTEILYLQAVLTLGIPTRLAMWEFFNLDFKYLTIYGIWVI